MLPAFYEGFCHESHRSYLFQKLKQMKNYDLYRQFSTAFHVCDLCGGFVYDYETSTQPERRRTET